MSLNTFFNFVEIRTKLASVIPFFLGTIYTLYRYRSFKLNNFIIMFISLLAFDMATTAINNYCDFKKADKLNVHKHESSNAMVANNIKNSTALAVIFTLLSIAVLFGIILVLNTNIIVLLIGAASFMVGILYTFGPIPISRMPLGELFSGIFMGFVIEFLSIYIHIFDYNIITLLYKNNILSLNINVAEIFSILLLSIPAVVCISNIMLANNICDIEKDVLNKRFTLPYYTGKENALLLFKYLYYMAYADIMVLLVFKILPLLSVLALITFIPVRKNIKRFTETPIKSKTFALSVKNFALINLTLIFSIAISIVVSKII